MIHLILVEPDPYSLAAFVRQVSFREPPSRAELSRPVFPQTTTVNTVRTTTLCDRGSNPGIFVVASRHCPCFAFSTFLSNQIIAHTALQIDLFENGFTDTVALSLDVAEKLAD